MVAMCLPETKRYRGLHARRRSKMFAIGAARSPAPCGLRYDIPCFTGICRENIQNTILPVFRSARKAAVIRMFDTEIP
jgi:hypothetical protein